MQIRQGIKNCLARIFGVVDAKFSGSLYVFFFVAFSVAERFNALNKTRIIFVSL